MVIECLSPMELVLLTHFIDEEMRNRIEQRRDMCSLNKLMVEVEN